MISGDLTLANRLFVPAAIIVFALTTFPALAQIAPPRTLDELKAETQARADRNGYPLTGLKPADVREALVAHHTLDRDEWAAAWGSVAERYATAAMAAEAGGKIKEAKEEYLMAWRLYSFARWPTENSPGKQKAYALALAAFQGFARHLDPPVETIRIPFEGKEIVGLLRLPKGVRPAPLLFSISALDSRKEEHVERGEIFLNRGIATLSLDMPGTGQAPIARRAQRRADVLQGARLRRDAAGDRRQNASSSRAEAGAGTMRPSSASWRRTGSRRWSCRAARSTSISSATGR